MNLSNNKMTPADRKMLMRRITIIRESYRLEADTDAALMLTTLVDVPDKIRRHATEFLQEQEPDAGWVYYPGRGASMTPPEPVSKDKKETDEIPQINMFGGAFPW